MTAQTKDDAPAISEDAIRLEQGTSMPIGSRYKVSVLSVRQDTGPDGTLAWQMNTIVFDRDTKEEKQQILREGDEVMVGATRYRLVRIVGPQDSARGYGIIEPVGR